MKGSISRWEGGPVLGEDDAMAFPSTAVGQTGGSNAPLSTSSKTIRTHEMTPHGRIKKKSLFNWRRVDGR